MTGPRREAVPRWHFVAWWMAMLLVFWGLVAACLPASRRVPTMAATVRYSLGDRSAEPIDRVWRYTGPRPESGQVLRVFYRQATLYPESNGVQGIAFTGTAERPDPATRVTVQAPPAARDFFTTQWIDVPPWPADRELWVGIRMPEKAAIWLEVGAMPHTGLTLPGFEIRREAFAQRQTLPAMGPVSARVVSADDPGPPAATPFAAVVAFAMAMAVAVPFLRGYRRWWVAAALFHAVLLCKAMEVLFPSQWLWGSFFRARMAPWPFWVGLVALQLACIPGVAALAGGRWYPGLARGLRRWPRWLTVPMLLLLAGGAYLALAPVRSLGLYGDAYGSLAHPGYDYHNPFATALYHAWKDGFQWWTERRGTIVNPGFADMNLIPRFVVLWVPLYVLGAGLIARQVGRSRREALLFFAILLLLKCTMAFYGYVEVYGPALAVQALLIGATLAGLRRAGVVLPSALSFFGYLLQMGGAMALPAIMVLWVVSLWRTERRVQWLATRLAATLVLALLLWANCLGMLYIFKHNQDPESFRRHVPALRVKWKGEEFPAHGLAMLVGSTGRDKAEVFLHWSKMHYTHFYLLPSREHASQVAGEILFVGGPVLPMLALAIAMGRRRAWRTAEWHALLGAGGAFLLSAIALSTNYPYPKDWDVFSIHSLWWSVALMVALTRTGFLSPAARRWMVAAWLMYLLWDTLPWIAYNLTWGPPAAERNFVFF